MRQRLPHRAERVVFAMFNLLKSDVYRLVHGKMLWVSIGALLIICLCGGLAVWFGTTPEFAAMVNEQAQENVETQEGISASNGADLTGEEVQALNEKVLKSRTYAYGNTFMTIFLELIVSLIAALLAASDFDSGFAKNICSGRQNRTVYYGEKLVLIALICGGLLLIGMLISDVVYAVAGFSYSYTETVGEFWAWMGLAWLQLIAYAFATTCVVWAARSKTLGVVFAALMSTGFVESLLNTAALGLSPAFPVVANVIAWFPVHLQKLMSFGGATLFTAGDPLVAGMPVAGQVLLVFGAIAVVCATLSLTACRRKDV